MPQRQIYFKPSDFTGVLSLDYLTQVIVDIIKDIRANDHGQYNYMINEIDELKNIELEVEAYKNNENVKQAQVMIDYYYNLYQRLLKISLELRKLLPKELGLAQYDNISYAFYDRKQRFYFEKLPISALVYNESTDKLQIDLEIATKNLRQRLTQANKKSYGAILNAHYNNFLKVLRNKKTQELPSGLNKGHVAEAFEEHLAQHHTAAYNFYNNMENQQETYYSDLSPWQKSILGEDLLESPANLWGTKKETNRHETITEAWVHVRSAKGTLRGTVMGDVGNMQVKEATNSGYGSKVNLVSFANLKKGVETYSRIMGDGNPNGPDIIEVAYEIAKYISEPITHSAGVQVNEMSEIKDLDAKVTNFVKKQRITKLVNLG